MDRYRERKTEPYAEEPEQVYSFFGLEARMEFGNLNRRFVVFLEALRNICVSRIFANWVEETLNTNPFVIPVAAGNHNHGVRRLQALSFGVIFIHIMCQAQDYQRVIGALRSPRSVSSGEFLSTDREACFQVPTMVGASFLASHPPLYVHSGDFNGTFFFYFMQ